MFCTYVTIEVITVGSCVWTPFTDVVLNFEVDGFYMACQSGLVIFLKKVDENKGKDLKERVTQRIYF